MSTTPNEPTPTPPTNTTPAASTPSPPPTPTGDPITLPDDHPLVKAYAAQKEQIKSLKSGQIDPDELKRLREIDEASKTEAQKQAEEVERLRKENEGYKTREQVTAWKAEVSAETGVPANVLAGSTKEEIEAHAETLKPLIGQQATEPPKPGVVPTVGKTPTATPNLPISEQIAAAEQAGDKELVGRLKAMQLAAAQPATTTS